MSLNNFRPIFHIWKENHSLNFYDFSTSELPIARGIENARKNFISIFFHISRRLSLE